MLLLVRIAPFALRLFSVLTEVGNAKERSAYWSSDPGLLSRRVPERPLHLFGWNAHMTKSSLARSLCQSGLQGEEESRATHHQAGSTRVTTL